MDTPQQMDQPQSGYSLSRPLSPIVTVAILLSTLVILMSILLPGSIGSHRKAREAALKAHLHKLRHAIELFKQDTGRYPLVLTELVAPDARHLYTPVKKGSFKGPYLPAQGGINNTGLPLNPMLRNTRKGQSMEVIVNHSWRYDAHSGAVHCAVLGRSVDGKRYTEL